MQDPATHGRMADSNATLGHYLRQITQVQIAGQIPPHTEKDNGFIEMAAFEHRLYSADVKPKCWRHQGRKVGNTSVMRRGGASKTLI